MLKLNNIFNKLNLETIKTNKGYLEDSPLMLELSLDSELMGGLNIPFIVITLEAGAVIDFRGEPLVVINQFTAGGIISYKASNKLLEGAYLKDYIKMLEIALELSKELKETYISYILIEEALKNG
jgi:hypothetical protein